MTSWATIAISAAVRDGAMEKIKMLRPRRSRMTVEATIWTNNQWHRSLTGDIVYSIITVGGLCQALCP
jgi:hypothetical protein